MGHPACRARGAGHRLPHPRHSADRRDTLPLNQILTSLHALWTDLQTFALSLAQPWRFYQVLILVGLLAAAHLGARWAEPRLTAWMRGLEGVRMRQLRLLVVLTRRTRLILFALLAWVAYLTMQAYTWPSRSYFIGIAATLATGWAVVAISTRVIVNPVMRAVIRWAAFILVTLNVLGITDQVAEVLDSVGVPLGENRVSLWLILKAAITLVAMVGLAGWLGGVAQRRLGRLDDMSPSFQVLAAKLVQIGLYAVAIVVGLQTIGFDLTSLTVLSGAIGLGLGFGLQKVVSNLVSGLIVLMDKSIKPGDVISLGETFGWVTELNARFAAVITRDGREYLIPNEDLITQQVVNWTHTNSLVRLDIFFGVSYESDPHQVRRIAREAAAAVSRVQPDPAPVCHIVGFGDSSIDFILRFWIADPTGGLTNVRGNVYLALWDALKANDIEIPFPRRDVTIRAGALPVAKPEADLPSPSG